MSRIAHISDIHFGRIAQPGIVEAIVEDVNGHDVDLVAASGDLTQRARTGQYRAAREMLDSFEAPWLTVPGNHDVFPWWRPGSRLMDPLRRFREHITDDMTPRYELDRAVVQGINTAYGWTVLGGRLGTEARAAIEAGLGGHESGRMNILVMHHHLIQLSNVGKHDTVRGARKALRTAEKSGVDMILCGHLHISHVEPIELGQNGTHLVIVSAGTATSDRGRGKHRQTNFYNLIDIYPECVRITERRFDSDTDGFETHGEHQFDR